jgi:uncharacterized membrane protein
MKKMTTKQLVLSGLIAALYVVLTAGLPLISYMGIQFRVSEILVLLAFFNPIFIPAVTVGTFIANFVGPFGFIDAVAGSAVSLLAMILIWQTRRVLGDKLVSLFVASLWPVVVNAIYVPVLLIALIPDFPDPALLVGAQVAFGEFVVVSVVGIAIFSTLRKNKQFDEFLK